MEIVHSSTGIRYYTTNTIPSVIDNIPVRIYYCRLYSDQNNTYCIHVLDYNIYICIIENIPVGYI